jgi:coenzyme F420-reducing hydrogenase gamma subunit
MTETPTALAPSGHGEPPPVAPEPTTSRPTLAVWKFASCDGCQLTLLNCEDELLAVADRVQVAYFPEATRAVVAGPYDVSLVEGSITTPGDAERIQQVRAASRTLVTIGACATSGGIQALRNFADVGQYLSIVYAHPAYLATLDRSTPISAHVTVDFQLRGCPIDKHQLLEVLAALLQGRRPRVPSYSVCVECKRRGTVCVAVAASMPCLGPVTQAGCGALCPSYHRGCYGCFGPHDTPNTASLAERLRAHGMPEVDVMRVFRTFNAGSEPFRVQSLASEGGDAPVARTVPAPAPGDPTTHEGAVPREEAAR